MRSVLLQMRDGCVDLADDENVEIYLPVHMEDVRYRCGDCGHVGTPHRVRPHRYSVECPQCRAEAQREMERS